MIANEERKTNGSCKYWTEYRILEEAKKFHSLTEFSKKASGAYDAACSLKILDKIRRVIYDK